MIWWIEKDAEMDADKLNGLITREDWINFSSDQRDWIVFNLIQKIEKRVMALEKRKRFDTSISAVSGFVGGITAFVGKMLFFPTRS